MNNGMPLARGAGASHYINSSKVIPTVFSRRNRDSAVKKHNFGLVQGRTLFSHQN